MVGLIAYGSLYPFNFKSEPLPPDLLAALRELTWARAGRGDRIANVLLYLPLGFCLYLWLSARRGPLPSICVATLGGSLLSLCIETSQVYVSSRVPSLADLGLNAAGSLLGALGGVAWNALERMMHLPARNERQVREPDAALLVLLWLAWRFAPFLPQTDLGKLKAALQPLFSPRLEPIAVFSFLACWLVVAQALEALVSRQRRLEALLGLIAAVLVGRLLVVDQALIPSELLALALLVPLVVVLYRVHPQPKRTFLVLVVITLSITQALAPFDFAATAGGFDWWPFLGWLQAGWETSLQRIDTTVLFGKLFLYAALFWVICEWSRSANVAMLVLVVLATTLEVLQIWLPAQRASITDPLLALAMGALLRSFHVRRRRVYARL